MKEIGCEGSENLEIDTSPENRKSVLIVIFAQWIFNIISFDRWITVDRWITRTKPVTPSFDIFCDPCLNKRLSKQSWGWWFESLSRPLWRHYYGPFTTRSVTSPYPIHHGNCKARTGGHFHYHGLSKMISNHVPSKVWDEVTCIFPIISGCTGEVWE